MTRRTGCRCRNFASHSGCFASVRAGHSCYTSDRLTVCNVLIEPRRSQTAAIDSVFERVWSLLRRPSRGQLSCTRCTTFASTRPYSPPTVLSGSDFPYCLCYPVTTQCSKSHDLRESLAGVPRTEFAAKANFTEQAQL